MTGCVFQTYLCAVIIRSIPLKKFEPMKKNLLLVFTLLVFSLLSKITVVGQTTITSDRGYAVNVTILPKVVLIDAADCKYGYNYKIALDYNISFSGDRIPSELYNIQGTLNSDSKSLYFDLPEKGGIGTTKTVDAYNRDSDCGTATVSSLGFNEVQIRISGPGINSRTINMPISNIPLPITLIDFNAQAEKAQVKLTWKTALEINNNYFSIEKSADGINWSVVKNVPGAHNSNSVLSYESFDENPYSGTSYYRLKQTDLDGKFTYSGVKVVKVTEISSNSIHAYPIPNSGNTVNFKGISDPSKLLVTVRDASGSSVYSSTLTSNSVVLPSLKPGLYMINLNNKMTGEVTNIKYVKI